VFAGPLVFPPPLLPAVISTVQEWYTTTTEKEGALVAMTNRGPTGDPAIVVVVFYNGNEGEGRKRFAKLIALGPVVNAAGMIPYEMVNSLQNELVPYGANYHMTGTVRGDKPAESEVAQEIFNQMLDISSLQGACASTSTPSMVVLWEFFHLKKAASVPADATAFRMRVEHSAMPVLIKWEGESTEATNDAKERLRRLKQVIEKGLRETFAGGMGENDTGYGNYGE
jgi:hypothetical protein